MLNELAAKIRQQQQRTRFVIDPDLHGRKLQVWCALTLSAAMYSILGLPLRIAFSIGFNETLLGFDCWCVLPK